MKVESMEKRTGSGNYFIHDLPMELEFKQEIIIPKKENEWMKTLNIVFRWKSIRKICRLIAKALGISKVIKSLGVLKIQLRDRMKSNLGALSQHARDKYLDFAEDFFSYQDKYVDVKLEITNEKSIKLKGSGVLDLVIDENDQKRVKMFLMTFVLSVLLISLGIFKQGHAQASYAEIRLISIDKNQSTSIDNHHVFISPNGKEVLKPITKNLVLVSDFQFEGNGQRKANIEHALGSTQPKYLRYKHL